MNIQDLGSIGELIGAVATVGTLIYLALQVRANTRALQATSIQTMMDGPRDRIVQPTIQSRDIADLHARGLTSFEDLDETDRVRFTWFLIEHVAQLQVVLNLHKHGLVPDKDYETWLSYIGSFVRTPGGSQAWPQVAAVMDDEVVAALNTHVAENQDLPSLLDLMPVMNKPTK